MKKNILFVIFFSLILSCEDEITVFVDREPGSISGQILPKGVGAIVKLYQGPLFQEVGTDFDGYFQFSNLSAGTYTLRANAPNYGTREFGRIQVEDGEGYDIGQLRLYEYPAPLVYSSPLNGETGVPLHYLDRLVHLYFDEILNLESLRTAFTITPPVSNMILNHETSRYPFPLYHSYYVGGDFKLGTLYEFTIDSTCETITGEKLEFSYSSTFETEHFKLERIIIPTYLYGNYQLILRFNNTINSSTLYNHLSIEPDIDIIIEGQIETAVIYPTLSWMPDTTFKLILSRNFQDIDGNSMQHDTTFIMYSERLKIDWTSPHRNQHFVPLNQPIRIDMNNLVDEATIPDAVSIEPSVDYDFITNVYSGRTNILMLPDSLLSNTLYTVTIDTSLRDYYGKPFGETYTFSFVTQ